MAIAVNLDRIHSRIIHAAESCGRRAGEIRLLAVSKTFPADRVREASRAGQRLFGENRIQEAQQKIPELADRDLEFHLIGHLQSNKAQRAVELFDVIQTVDSLKLARRIDRMAGERGKRQQIFVQVNIGEEDQKHGLNPAEVVAAVNELDKLPNLEILGLMAIPPYETDPERSRPYFRRQRLLLADVNRLRSRPARELSMGMSHDFEVAIEEGATLIRVGTAIFGPRSKPPESANG